MSCFSVALSVPTRGLRPLERSFHAFQWLCQCQLAAFGRSKGVFMLFSGFVSANSRPSAARKEFSCFSVALSVPTRGLRPLERSFHAFQWLCQCQLAAFGRSKGVFMLFSGFVSANSRPSAARKEFSCFSVALFGPPYFNSDSRAFGPPSYG
ncbi:hypothetical protein Ddc_01337 [Ditylenchus destructor]|nr:hypothetical protein Ddc_01337 [Ditylenchus destructor]